MLHGATPTGGGTARMPGGWEAVDGGLMSSLTRGGYACTCGFHDVVGSVQGCSCAFSTDRMISRRLYSIPHGMRW